jgi:SAM-dependent methyltransferase
MSPFSLVPESWAPSGAAWMLCIEAPVLFEIGGSLVLLDGEGRDLARHSLAELGGWLHWLPRGRYRLLLQGAVPGVAAARLELVARHGREELCLSASAVAPSPASRAAPLALSWSGHPDPASLPHRRGLQDWFHRHFDHAALTVGEYLLKDSPLLGGCVLDLGCGDGITDLGLFWRWRPRLLVGIDPFAGFERLPRILEERGLPAELLAPDLAFLRADGNFLPFRDDSFDVVVSWGSLEHIAGGHRQALIEVRRVLRPGGLFFAHPGLYYSNLGHHLGEFSDEPFLHLRRSREALRELVLSTPPRYIDRAGEFASPEQYWRWFEELNRITVSSFEQELRALDFEPWRVAIRTEPIIEYTPELLSYPMQDLATAELYVACFNRKRKAAGR